MSKVPHVDLRVPRGAQALVIMLHGAGASKDWGFFPWLAEVLWEQRARPVARVRGGEGAEAREG